jgi:hypothetical protein
MLDLSREIHALMQIVEKAALMRDSADGLQAHSCRPNE